MPPILQTTTAVRDVTIKATEHGLGRGTWGANERSQLTEEKTASQGAAKRRRTRESGTTATMSTWCATWCPARLPVPHSKFGDRDEKLARSLHRQTWRGLWSCQTIANQQPAGDQYATSGTASASNRRVSYYPPLSAPAAGGGGQGAGTERCAVGKSQISGSRISSFPSAKSQVPNPLSLIGFWTNRADFADLVCMNDGLHAYCICGEGALPIRKDAQISSAGNERQEQENRRQD